MYVPNYIPEPLEVPGNVTEEPYPLRIHFVRRVAVLYLVSVLITAGICHLHFPHAEFYVPLIAIAVCLVGLDLLRIVMRGKPAEAKVSSLCLPAALVFSAWLLREIQWNGWPIYQALVGPICVFLYVFLSGRDFSFVGCCVLSFISSSVCVAGIAVSSNLDRVHAGFALGFNAIFVIYLVYDFASLLARRRRGEELAAVVDLYRDVFNFFGYAVRMVKHWRKHRIWTSK